MMIGKLVIYLDKRCWMIGLWWGQSALRFCLGPVVFRWGALPESIERSTF